MYRLLFTLSLATMYWLLVTIPYLTGRDHPLLYLTGRDLTLPGLTYRILILLIERS